MEDKLLLFMSIAKAAVLVTIGCFALALAFKFAPRRAEQEILGVAIALVPPCIAGWWLFRMLSRRWRSREAKAVAITFTVLSPVSVLVGTLLAQIPGAVAGFMGRPVGLLGAFLGIVVAVTICTFLPALAALWIARKGRQPRKTT